MSFTATFILALSINCSTVDLAGKATLDTDEHLEKALCVRFQEANAEASFDVLSKRVNYQENTMENGTFSVGDIKAGRVKVEWKADGSNKKSTTWVKAEFKKEVWVLKKYLPPYTDITRSHVIRQVKNIAPLMGVKALIVESPIGKVSAKALRKGDVLTEADISNPPLVRKNDNVSIVVTSGALRLTSSGIALQHGWSKGERVLVKAENASEPVYAEVFSENTVYVAM